MTGILERIESKVDLALARLDELTGQVLQVRHLLQQDAPQPEPAPPETCSPEPAA
ncbi:MAG: hypothetical protein KatS3mg082_1810 [Nitrospiraceae bacterium]|nr:MAG: hypothetical protein KatS3mg082_1810 [Nitrospiraceae bacterium]